MAATLIVPVVDEGLGNSAYLVDLGDGRALAVDVPRDLRAVRAAARRHELTVAFAADTHLQADFLNGAVQLAGEDGAQILASADGCRAFGHRARLMGRGRPRRADAAGRATPGHTAEHLAYLLLDGRQVLGVFTGGSLLAGAAARTDLSGPEETESLAPVAVCEALTYGHPPGRCGTRKDQPGSPVSPDLVTGQQCRSEWFLPG